MRLRVRFAETDQMGIAHHSAYVVWCEAGRVEWLRERGLDYRQMENEGISLAVSSIRLEYRRSALFDDEIEVATRLTLGKSRRVGFSYSLTRRSDEAVLAVGETLHTPIDRQGRAIRLPEVWLGKLEGFLEP